LLGKKDSYKILLSGTEFGQKRPGGLVLSGETSPARVKRGLSLELVLGIKEAPGGGFGHCLGSVPDVQLLQDTAQVSLDRGLTDEEF